MTNNSEAQSRVRMRGLLNHLKSPSLRNFLLIRKDPCVVIHEEFLVSIEFYAMSFYSQLNA